MGDIVQINFTRQKVFAASDGELFTTDEERREYELQLKLITGLKNFYTDYGICPKVIANIVQIGVANAGFLANLYASINGERRDHDGPEH